MADDDCEVAGHCLLPQLRARLDEVEAERDRARENSLRRLEANIDLRARAEAAEAIIAECGCQTEAGWAEHERVRAMEAALARVLAVPYCRDAGHTEALHIAAGCCDPYESPCAALRGPQDEEVRSTQNSAETPADHIAILDGSPAEFPCLPHCGCDTTLMRRPWCQRAEGRRADQTHQEGNP